MSLRLYPILGQYNPIISYCTTMKRLDLISTFTILTSNHQNYQRCPKKYSTIACGKLTQLWKITIFHGKTHYKWQFSIAFCKRCQRVFPYSMNSPIPVICFIPSEYACWFFGDEITSLGPCYESWRTTHGSWARGLVNYPVFLSGLTLQKSHVNHWGELTHEPTIRG